MARVLAEEDRKFRQLVVEMEGRQTKIATALGISASAVSHRLWSQKHAEWWAKYRIERKSRDVESSRPSYSYDDGSSPGVDATELEHAPQLLSPPNAAKLLRCSHSTVLRLIDSGEIAATRVSNRWIVDKDELKKWVIR
jgi:excisionase family DNA binding protein